MYLFSLIAEAYRNQKIIIRLIVVMCNIIIDLQFYQITRNQIQTPPTQRFTSIYNKCIQCSFNGLAITFKLTWKPLELSTERNSN